MVLFWRSRICAAEVFDYYFMTSISSVSPEIFLYWEKRLRDAATTGEPLDLAGTDVIDPAAAETWPTTRCVPAGALRRVLAFTDEKTLDPRGLLIRGARFCDELSAAHIDFPRPLHFFRCAFDARIDLNGAKFKELSFEGSHMRGLVLDNAEVLDDLMASRVKAVGKISAKGIKIGGCLVMTGATLLNEKAVAIDLDSARVGGEVLLNKGFEARGEVLALGVRISGQLNLRGATLNNPFGDALSLDGAEISGGLLAALLIEYLDEGKVEWRFMSYGTVRAVQARIGGAIELSGAVLRDPAVKGYVLYLDGLELNGMLTANDFTTTGTVRAVGASIQGHCDFSGAVLRNCMEDNYALDLENVDIASGVLAKGVKAHGLVNAVGAHIKGGLDLTGAKLYGCLRPEALNLDRAEIGGEVLATYGFESHATISALITKIGGKLDLTEATLRRSAYDALLLRSAKIGRLVFCASHLEGVDLSRAEIAVLETDETLPTPLSATGWKIADLQGPLRSDTKMARRWLNSYPKKVTHSDAEKVTHSYPEKVTPVQPWWALADVYERNGDAAAAKRMRFFAANNVTIESLRRKPALFRGAYGAVAGYGYYPLMAIIWLVVVIVLGYWTVSSSPEYIVPTNNQRAVEAMQPSDHRAGGAEQKHMTLGHDVAVDGTASSQPFTAETPCSAHPGYPCWDGFAFTLNSLVSAWGNPSSDWTIQPNAPLWLTTTLFLLKVAAWGLLGLLLAGVTGLLRRS
jgi:uncharacterized protein YjbI with pentapeptide repeats